MAGSRIARALGIALFTLWAGRAVWAQPASAPASAPAAASEDLAAFLVAPAEAATKAGKLELAVSLWRGVVAIRGDGDEATWKLADVWVQAEEFQAAAEELSRFAAASGDPARADAAKKRIGELVGHRRAATGKEFQPQPAEAEAKEAFKRGRQYFDQKKYAEAAALFRAGTEMAPDLPGNFRELGECYDKLGKPEEASRFFMRYLWLRPFSKNLEPVRARLVKEGNVGKLSILSSFPSEVVMMNRQTLPQKLPVVDVAVAPGHYRLLCYTEKYHFASYVDVDVAKGAVVKAAFNWAVIQNKLDPWGRIVMEDPDRPDWKMDLGLWSEVGVPLPLDNRKLRFYLHAGDGSRNKTLSIKLVPGATIPLEW